MYMFANMVEDKSNQLEKWLRKAMLFMETLEFYPYSIWKMTKKINANQGTTRVQSWFNLDNDKENQCSSGNRESAILIQLE